MPNIPTKTDTFFTRLVRIIPDSFFEEVCAVLNRPRSITIRINTLKTSCTEVEEYLHNHRIDFVRVDWCANALVLAKDFNRSPVGRDMLDRGLIYIQSLSSMLPPLVLDPRSGERILDLCAAPGSKTSQMAALMHNQGEMVCVENIRKRVYKLRAVLTLLGVTNARLVVTDGRRFRDAQFFDRVLVDAPCSSEGRFNPRDPKTLAYWSPRKIKEMARKQKGLLLNGLRLVKKGGVLVYSTCTFAPEENEAVVDWVLRKTAGAVEVLPVAVPNIKTYATLAGWSGRPFDARIRDCARILPTPEMEGFFIAKLKKTADL